MFPPPGSDLARIKWHKLVGDCVVYCGVADGGDVRAAKRYMFQFDIVDKLAVSRVRPRDSFLLEMGMRNGHARRSGFLAPMSRSSNRRNLTASDNGWRQMHWASTMRPAFRNAFGTSNVGKIESSSSLHLKPTSGNPCLRRLMFGPQAGPQGPMTGERLGNTMVSCRIITRIKGPDRQVHQSAKF